MLLLASDKDCLGQLHEIGQYVLFIQLDRCCRTQHSHELDEKIGVGYTLGRQALGLDGQSAHERGSHSNKFSEYFCSVILDLLVLLALQTTLVARETKGKIQDKRQSVYELSDGVAQNGEYGRGRALWVDIENRTKICQRARRVTLQVWEEDRHEWAELESASGRKKISEG